MACSDGDWHQNRHKDQRKDDVGDKKLNLSTVPNLLGLRPIILGSAKKIRRVDSTASSKMD